MTSSDDILEVLPEIMRRLMSRHPMPAGIRELTLGQFRALKFVTDHPGCTMGELAKALEVSLGAATGLVDRLIQHDLVARVADPKDRRRVRLQLTEQGRRGHLEAKRQAARRVGTALATLSPEQQQQIATALRLLREALTEA